MPKMRVTEITPASFEENGTAKDHGLVDFHLDPFKGDMDVGDGCWRQNVLVTDLIHRENHQHNEKSRQYNDSATNISN